MKRARLILPLFGLLLFMAAWASRGLLTPGLALDPFPPPADVQLQEVSLPLPSSFVRGVVHDSEGRPVPEALVKVVVDEEPVWTYTDARGRFELEALPAGRHRAVIWTRRHHMNQLELIAPADELVITLAQDFGELERLPALERVTLSGELVAALGGQVLRGYEIALRPLEGPQAFGAPIERRAVVGADRTFAFEDLLLGEYRVTVQPPWARGGRWPDLVDPAMAGYVHTRAAIDRPLRVTMASGELHGALTDERGVALAGALLLLHPSGAAERPWPPVTSDDAGAFVLRDLPPGDYELEISAGEARVDLRLRAEAGQRTPVDVPPLATRAARKQ